MRESTTANFRVKLIKKDKILCDIRMAQWSRKLLFIFIETRLELLAPRSDKEAIAPKDMITGKKKLNCILSFF